MLQLNLAGELELEKTAFLLAQERYEIAERKFTAAIERGEWPSRTALERLEREYQQAAIVLAMAVCGVKS